MAKAKKPDGRRENGRPKGSINKRSEETYQKAKNGGVLPVEYLLKRMRNGALPGDVRDRCAAAAAPYIHARLQAVAVSGAVSMTHEQALDALDD
jgi:hypothetical protein